MSGYLKTMLLFIALSLGACASAPQKESLSEQGYQAMEAGNMEEAERLLTAAVEENPNDLQAVIHLATLYQKTNRPEQARPLYQFVIDAEESAAETGQDPEEAARLAQIARDSIAQMDREEAMRQEALRLEAEAAQRAAAPPPPPPEPEPVAPPPVQREAGHHIQVGAYSMRANAEHMHARLMQRHAALIKGKDVEMMEIDRLTKVRIGPYKTIDDAERACRNLKRAGVDCFRVMH